MKHKLPLRLTNNKLPRRVVRVVEWFSETLFIKNFFSEGGGRTTMVKSKRDGGEEEELGLGSVTFTRGLGRKRVLFSNSVRESLLQIPATESTTPVKRQRSITTDVCERSRLESLPQELLIQVVCGVDHEDLKSLNIVSKSIREASLIAKELHFSFTTPKKTRAVRNQLDFEDSSQQVEDVEPPNAPVRHRWTEAKRKEQLSNVSVALFT